MNSRTCERWIWTELIGFDNTQDDCGVGEYLQNAGFVPDTICLLMTSVDFVLSFKDRGEDYTLPPDFCARDGHEFNQVRERQEWTGAQLKRLIDELHSREIDVFLTVFTSFYGDRFHHEWLSDHREVLRVQRGHGQVNALNPLSRLDDGSYFQEYFFSQLVRVMKAYGFDGWHGADGWGPLNGPLWDVPMSDDMVGQFAEWLDEDLPGVIADPCGHDVDLLEARAEALWREYRHEWIDFFADRWTDFWTRGLDSLHAAGKQAVINSAWGRAPWESLYRYGIDYRKIVDAGVDGIIVETVASGLAMDPRPGCAVPSRHFDFLSMLLLIRAYVPDARLIFLHNVHDVVEQWDAIRHVPTVLEKDIFSLLNVYHHTGDGLIPAADGLLACLGDAISDCHWRWLRQRWEMALSAMPESCHGPTLVWSDTAMHAQTDEFIARRTWTLHRLLFHLQTLGAPIQATVRIEELDSVTGPLLVINPHLLPEDERAGLAEYNSGPLITIGPGQGLPGGVTVARDVFPPHALSLRVHGDDVARVSVSSTDGDERIPEDMLAVADTSGYWDHMYFRRVSDEFLTACVKTMQSVSDPPFVTEWADEVTLMAMRLDEGVMRVALKSQTPVYAEPVVQMGAQVADVSVVTSFPAMRIEPDGSTFSVRVPGKGITVVDVTLA